MDILVSYRGTSQPGWATGDCLVRALRKLGHNVTPYAKYYQQDDWVEGQKDLPLKSEPPDLLIFLECCDDDPQYIELAPLDCPKVYWEFDTGLHEEASLHLIAAFRFDVVFMANHDMAVKHGHRYLPYAVDPHLYYPAPEHGTEPPAIIGTPFPERLEFARKAGIDVVRVPPGEEYAAKIRRLSMHVHYFDSGAGGGQGMVVARPLETMASRVCLAAQDTDAMRRHWQPGIHYVAFDSPGDLREAMALPDGVRWGIAQRGFASIMKHHTYFHRAEAILEAVGWRQDQQH